MNLVQWLKARQGDDTEEAFAAKLGISPSLWSLLQSGQRQPSLRLVRGAVAAFPSERSEIFNIVLDHAERDLIAS